MPGDTGGCSPLLFSVISHHWEGLIMARAVVPYKVRGDESLPFLRRMVCEGYSSWNLSKDRQFCLPFVFFMDSGAPFSLEPAKKTLPLDRSSRVSI